MSETSDRSQQRMRIAIATIIAFIALALVGRHHTGRATLLRSGLSRFQTRQVSADNVIGSKWIVLTSIAYPTGVVKKLASLKGWRFLVVADKMTPDDWSHDNVVFLSIDQQQRLPYNINKHVPWNHYGRKNIGYLYAITHGAKVIYETDDDKELIVPTILQLVPGSIELPELSPNVRSNPPAGDYTVLDVPDNNTVNFNPYPLFGVHHMWPRGLPFQSVGDKQPICFKRKPARPLIQQGLANNAPDMDAMHLLTLTGGVAFDMDTFSVVLPQGTMAPLNSQNTLFLHDALWAMVLPVTTTKRVCDVWRGYWSQRLLWNIGGNLAYTPPTVSQQPTPYTAFEDFRQESALYKQAGSLVADLRSWVPSSGSLPEQMVELARFMADRQYWGQEEVYLVQAWVADLQAAGYRFPSLKEAAAEPQDKGQSRAPVVTTSDRQPTKFMFAKQWCKHMDKILVVNINQIASFHGHLTKFLFGVYKPWFREVFFTGETTEGLPFQIPNFVQCHTTNKYTMAFMPGHFAQVCLAEVIRHLRARGLPVNTGFLYVNDDVTFSPCMLALYNSSRIWYDQPFVTSYAAAKQQSMTRPAVGNSVTINITNVSSNKQWHFGGDFSNGQSPGRLAHHTQRALSNAYGWMAARVESRLEDPGLSGQHMFGFGQADFFYIPARYATEYDIWARHMREYFVFSEVAVPNILGLLGDGISDYEIFPATSLWSSSRETVVSRVQQVMPLARSMDLRVSCEVMIGQLAENQWQWTLPPCELKGPQQNGTTSQSELIMGLNNFVIHPLKLSNGPLRQYWLTWWQSQSCAL